LNYYTFQPVVALKVIFPEVSVQVLKTMEIRPVWCNTAGFVHAGHDSVKHLAAYILSYMHILYILSYMHILKSAGVFA